MTQRMTPKEIQAQEDAIRGQHERAYAYTKRDRARRGICEPQSLPDIGVQEEQDSQRQKQHVAVDVLQNERKRVLASIRRARLPDRARRRVRPKRFVVRAAVV